MPQVRVKNPETLNYLSVLDESGEVDEALIPDISDDCLKTLYRMMVLARRFDERMLELQREGRLGTFAPVKGQEAAQLGSISAINERDWYVPSYRETACALWRGIPMEAILLYNAGYNEGGATDAESRNLPISIPVGTQPLHAVGIGYAAALREEDVVAITYFGDGATSEGDFHEALNFAGVFGSPTVFICQNNQWAISVPRRRQSAAQTIAQKAVAYGIASVQVDGNDILAVHTATTQAAERARQGDGPTLIELITYRMEVHTTADDPSRYRDEEEVEEWKQRDPITRFSRYLEERELLSESDQEEIAETATEDIAKAWQAAQEKIDSLDDPQVIFDHQFESLPPFLDRQRQAFEARRGGEVRADHADESDAGNDERDD